jgi:hypothetical protein
MIPQRPSACLLKETKPSERVQGPSAATSHRAEKGCGFIDRAPQVSESRHRLRALKTTLGFSPNRLIDAGWSLLSARGSESETGQEPGAKRRLPKDALWQRRLPRQRRRRSWHSPTKRESAASAVAARHTLSPTSHSAYRSDEIVEQKERARRAKRRGEKISLIVVVSASTERLLACSCCFSRVVRKQSSRAP